MYNPAFNTFEGCVISMVEYGTDLLYMQFHTLVLTILKSHAPLLCTGDGLQHTLYTVFIRIVAAATINFSFTRVQLLIEGSSYSRAAFINFGPIYHPENGNMKD